MWQWQISDPASLHARLLEPLSPASLSSSSLPASHPSLSPLARLARHTPRCLRGERQPRALDNLDPVDKATRTRPATCRPDRCPKSVPHRDPGTPLLRFVPYHQHESTTPPLLPTPPTAHSRRYMGHTRRKNVRQAPQSECTVSMPLVYLPHRRPSAVSDDPEQGQGELDPDQMSRRVFIAPSV